MSSIFEIYAENGNVQATGDGGIVFGLSATGNITLTDDGQAHPQPMVTAQVAVTGSNPIFAWKANGHICVERVTVSGSTFRFYIRAKSSSAIGLQYWIFDSATQAQKDPSMADIEFALWDEYGVKTFDATTAMMRVATAVEQPETSTAIPYGRFVQLGSTTDITVPAGRVWAIAQVSPAFVFTTYDTGGYSNSENAPDIIIRDPEGGTPGDPGLSRWRQQELQSYQATGGYVGGNVIRVGLSQFEYWNLGWQPRDSQPFINVHGQVRHIILDVTNFVAAGAIDPTNVVATVNATSRQVSNGGATTISHSITPASTAAASGGTAPYSFEWQYVAGDVGVYPYNLSQFTASFQTFTTDQPAGSSRSAIWRCRVTDANGYVGYGPEVTFTHVAEAYSQDFHPDAFTLGNQSFATNDPTIWNGPVQTVTGINQTITLRFQSYDPAGAMSAFVVHVYRDRHDGQGWVHMGSLDPRSGNPYVDFTVINGDSLHYAVSGSTNSGRQEFAFTMVIFNGSTGWNQLSNHRVTTVVDADNNYQIGGDVTPDPVNWANVYYHEQFGGQVVHVTETQYFTGITTPITVRVTGDQLFAFGSGQSGGWASADFYMYPVVNESTAGGQHISYGNWGGTPSQQSFDMTIPPNAAVYFVMQFSVSDQLGMAANGSGGGTFTVTNQSTGGTVLDGFTVNLSANDPGMGGPGGPGGPWEPGGPGGPIIHG